MSNVNDENRFWTTIFTAVLIAVSIAGALFIGIKVGHMENATDPKAPFAINVKSQSLYDHDYLVFVATSGETVEGTSVIHSESCTNHPVATLPPLGLGGYRDAAPGFSPGSLFYQHPTVRPNARRSRKIHLHRQRRKGVALCLIPS